MPSHPTGRSLGRVTKHGRPLVERAAGSTSEDNVAGYESAQSDGLEIGVQGSINRPSMNPRLPFPQATPSINRPYPTSPLPLVTLYLRGLTLEPRECGVRIIANASALNRLQAHGIAGTLNVSSRAACKNSLRSMPPVRTDDTPPIESVWGCIHWRAGSYLAQILALISPPTKAT